MNEMCTILGMGIAIFITRYPLLGMAEKIEFPNSVKTVLNYVPLAILVALILPSILIPNGEKINISFSNEYMLGGIVVFIIGFFSENVVITSTVGFIVFLGIKWLLKM